MDNRTDTVHSVCINLHSYYTTEEILFGVTVEKNLKKMLKSKLWSLPRTPQCGEVLEPLYQTNMCLRISISSETKANSQGMAVQDMYKQEEHYRAIFL